VNDQQTVQSGSYFQAAALSALDLFKDLPLSCIHAIQDASTVRDFLSGHTFFRRGETGEVLFFLEKGAVQTFRTFGKKKLIIAELNPPAIFGEMGCIGQRMYHCSAQATKPSRIRTISRTDLDALLEEYPVLTRRLLDLVSQRFVRVLIDLDAASFRRLIPRLANLLLERAEGDFVHNLTHKEIAEHLRVYRESATAALGELKTAGIVEVKRKQIRILNRNRLERAARE
jgi:CRP-like cAMP-binding protein